MATEIWKDEDFTIIKEKIMPVCVKCFEGVTDVENLLVKKPACISFGKEDVATFSGKGSYVVLDFGKELCGSLRVVTRATKSRPAMFRITFGESLTEACSKFDDTPNLEYHKTQINYIEYTLFLHYFPYYFHFLSSLNLCIHLQKSSSL